MKIAVFETSEIFEIQWDVAGRGPVHVYDPVASFRDERGLHQVYSRGNLERAIARGFKVYVASTREKLGRHDDWWIKLVGEGAIHLARDPDHENYDEDRSAAISAGWMGVFEALDLPWPTRPSGEPDFWTAARSNLRSLGIASGRDFEPKA